MSDLTLTLAETGETLSLPHGDTIVLRLPEIGGTAFLWHLAEPQNYTVIKDTYEISGDAPGGQSYRLLHLRLATPGTYLLRLDRHRPWETSQEGDAVFQATIIAE